MKDSPELFELIRSLSPNEKRYISMSISSHGENPAYYKLFKAFETLKEHDTEALYESIKRETFVHRLPAIKHYLHQLILKNLRSFHSGTTMDVNMHEAFIEVDILYQKGLLSQANKSLQKIQKDAEQREKFELLNICYSWEREINRERLFSKSKTELLHFYRKQQLNNKKIENLNSYLYLMDQLFHFNNTKGVARSKADRKWLQHFLKEPLIKDINKALSYTARSLHYDIRSICFYMLLDYKQSLQNVIASLKFEEEYIATDKTVFPAFIDVNTNKILLHIYLKDFDNAISTLKEIEQIPVRAKKEKWKYTLNDGLLFQIDRALNHFGMLILGMSGRYQAAVEYIEKMEKLMQNSLHKIGDRSLLVFNYYSAYIYFILGNYKLTLTYLRKILNYQKADTLLREDIYCYSKLLYLITHYELQSGDLPSYLLKSTYRFLSQRNRIYATEDAILSFIRNKLLKNTNPQLATKNFVELRNRLEKISDDPHEKRILDYFDFISWLDSKITHRPFLEIMKKKHGDKTVLS